MTRLVATYVLCFTLLAWLLPDQAEARRSHGYKQVRGKAQTARQVRRLRTRSPRNFRSRYVLAPSLRSMFDGASARRDQIAHGGWNTRKQIRTKIYQAKFSDHGKKHIRARTETEAVKFSTRAAQYMPGMKTSSLEKTALLKGLWLQRPNGAMWSIFRFDRPVGYDGGKKTHWIRAEISSGTFHGHPMSVERVRKYIKNAD